MDFTIEKLSVSDLSLAKQFLIWSQEDTRQHIPSDDYISKLLTNNAFYLLVALENGKIVGGLTAYELPMYQKEESEMFLYEIGVEEKYRQQGIATNLIDNLKEICIKKRIRTIFVGTEKDNLPARKLYKKSGGELEEIAWFTYEL